METGSVRPLGEIIRSQRRLAQMSLRRLAQLSAVSNPYLSQIERGLHEPSFRVLSSVADALDVSTESLLRQAGMLAEDAPDPTAHDSAVERAVTADPRLSEAQRTALISVYRSYVGDH